MEADELLMSLNNTRRAVAKAKSLALAFRTLCVETHAAMGCIVAILAINPLTDLFRHETSELYTWDTVKILGELRHSLPQ